MRWHEIILTCLLGVGAIAGYAVASDGPGSISQVQSMQQKIDALEMGEATLNDILARFGEPQGYYYFGGNTYRREEIKDNEQTPNWYVMPYDDNKLIFSLLAGRLAQIQVMERGYSYRGISVGSTLDEVYTVFGEPEEYLDVNPHTTPILTPKTILCRFTVDGVPIKLYAIDTRTFGCYAIDDKVVTLVRAIR